jgi:glycosyltransferase involved in cell wall biosynthesis
VHIVVVAHTRYALRQPFAGGLESLTWHLVQGLVDRGHRVTVFAADGSDELPGVDYLYPEQLHLSDAARGDASMPEEGWLQRHHAYLRLMLDLAERRDVDVVHNHALHYLPAAMAPSLPMQSVLTLHTPPTPWLESALTAARVAARVGPPPLVTAVSRHTADSWAHLVRARVVPNGVDTRSWGPGPGGDTLVWSGRIVPEKAPHLAVRIARAAGMPLVLAGPVCDQDYARSQLWPLLGDTVHYAGHLSAPELARLVGRSAAALVTPAWDEPYGLVAAEALSCGTPVLALDRGGLGEVVAPGTGVLVPSMPGRDLVLDAAAALPGVLTLSRAECRRHAEVNCSLDRMVDSYLQLYAENQAVPA